MVLKASEGKPAAKAKHPEILEGSDPGRMNHKNQLMTENQRKKTSLDTGTYVVHISYLYIYIIYIYVYQYTLTNSYFPIRCTSRVS